MLQLVDEVGQLLLSQSTSLGLHAGIHLVQGSLNEAVQRVGYDVCDGVVENGGDDTDEDVGQPVNQNVATESNVQVAV